MPNNNCKVRPAGQHMNPLSSLEARFCIDSDSRIVRQRAAKLTARGGLTRGPSIKVLSPADSKVKMPFDMKLVFEPHGGANIDPASVKMTYLKSPLVDLTERIKPYISASGIDMAKVEAPPGEHHLKIQVTDSKGRVGSTIVNFVVMK